MHEPAFTRLAGQLAISRHLTQSTLPPVERQLLCNRLQCKLLLLFFYGRKMDVAFVPPRLSMKANLTEGFDKDGHEPGEDSSNSQKRTPFQKSRGQGTKEKEKGLQELLKKGLRWERCRVVFCFRAHHKGLLPIRQQHLAGVLAVGVSGAMFAFIPREGNSTRLSDRVVSPIDGGI
jgi:hypothetical protein